MTRNPVQRLFEGMLAAGHCDLDFLEHLTDELSLEVQSVWDQALELRDHGLG